MDAIGFAHAVQRWDGRAGRVPQAVEQLDVSVGCGHPCATKNRELERRALAERGARRTKRCHHRALLMAYDAHSLVIHYGRLDGCDGCIHAFELVVSPPSSIARARIESRVLPVRRYEDAASIDTARNA